MWNLCSPVLYVYFPLDEGLRDVRAIDFDVDFSVFLLLLLLFMECPSVADEVERQQEAQHADNKKPNVDLEDNTRISRARGFHLCVSPFGCVCVCLHTQSGSPPRGPIMARNRGCCSRANTALTKDCMPVRLPNWEDGYLERQKM